MVQIKIEKVDILSIRKNPDNPRVMNKQKFRKLIESIKEFPQMLKLRPIVVNSDGLILGGNKRYTACLELNHKQVYIIKAEDLTDDQIKQFIIKDNVGFGDWDWDILANSWDTKQLQDWGMDVWNPSLDEEFKPEYNPTSDNKEMTSEEYEKKKQEIDNRTHETSRDFIECLCPKCFHEFNVESK